MENNIFLQCISEGIKIVIPATEGKRTIYDAEETFPGGIDAGNKNRDVKPGSAKLATPVKVYELVEDATFEQIFCSLKVEELQKLCLTDEQIIEFCKLYPQWLCVNGHGTLFLTELGGNFIVSNAYGYSGPFRLDHFTFGFECAWGWRYGYHIVVPKQE